MYFDIPIANTIMHDRVHPWRTRGSIAFPIAVCGISAKEHAHLMEMVPRDTSVVGDLTFRPNSTLIDFCSSVAGHRGNICTRTHMGLRNGARRDARATLVSHTRFTLVSRWLFYSDRSHDSPRIKPCLPQLRLTIGFWFFSPTVKTKGWCRGEPTMIKRNDSTFLLLWNDTCTRRHFAERNRANSARVFSCRLFKIDFMDTPKVHTALTKIFNNKYYSLGFYRDNTLRFTFCKSFI